MPTLQDLSDHLAAHSELQAIRTKRKPTRPKLGVVRPGNPLCRDALFCANCLPPPRLTPIQHKRAKHSLPASPPPSAPHTFTVLSREPR